MRAAAATTSGESVAPFSGRWSNYTSINSPLVRSVTPVMLNQQRSATAWRGEGYISADRTTDGSGLRTCQIHRSSVQIRPLTFFSDWHKMGTKKTKRHESLQVHAWKLLYLLVLWYNITSAINRRFISDFKYDTAVSQQCVVRSVRSNGQSFGSGNDGKVLYQSADNWQRNCGLTADRNPCDPHPLVFTYRRIVCGVTWHNQRRSTPASPRHLHLSITSLTTPCSNWVHDSIVTLLVIRHGPNQWQFD